MDPLLALPGIRGIRARLPVRRPAGRALVGWVSADTLGSPHPSFDTLPPAVAMRVASIARFLNRAPGRLWSEMYRPGRPYDVVVFVKAMDARCRDEAERIKAGGGRVVFDANVNYYEVWGDYEIPGTEPTELQQHDARTMTELADLVVADSSYLRDVVARLNPNVEWIPDNVDVRLFRPPGDPRPPAPGLRLVWSGMQRKALPLLDLLPVLADLDGAELVLVSNEPPVELDELRRALPTTFEPFALRSYARLLRTCDAIISPKRLVNGYELGHTEWKITLGMACGLPAVAAPQQSYIEAIEADGGGFVARTPEEWRDALVALGDPGLRRELGARARRTVVERYSTEVVAPRYRAALEGLLR
ncbi:MAG: hypothetical protein QOE36_3474 [Gaiellaceae bacterium]|nr:hypothetical protein [Gaiellaceae bacterium]